MGSFWNSVKAGFNKVGNFFSGIDFGAVIDWGSEFLHDIRLGTDYVYDLLKSGRSLPVIGGVIDELLSNPITVGLVEGIGFLDDLVQGQVSMDDIFADLGLSQVVDVPENVGSVNPLSGRVPSQSMQAFQTRPGSSSQLYEGSGYVNASFGPIGAS